MIFSCRDCENRYVGCHGKCEKYIEEKRVYDEARNKNSLGNTVRFGDKNGHRVMRRHRPVSTHGRINKI